MTCAISTACAPSFAHHRLGLDVLDGVVEGGLQLVQRRCGAEVLRADDRPVETDGGQVVRQARHGRHILLASTCAWRVSKSIVSTPQPSVAQYRRCPIQLEIVLRAARPHRVEARRVRHGSQHHSGRQAHDLPSQVHLRAMFGVNFPRFVRRAMHADLIQDLQRGRLEGPAAARRSRIADVVGRHDRLERAA